MHTAAIINRQLALPFLVEYDLHEWIPDNFEEVELGSVHPYVMERE
jgi:hypothetical protein